MEKVFVDTSGWVALFVGNDRNHERAVSVYNGLRDSRVSLYTSDYCIDETITTIMARGNHKQSVIAGQAIISSRLVEIVFMSGEYFQSAWKLYRKYDDKVFSFTDITSFVIMKNLGIRKAFSFDRGFLQAGIILAE